MRHRAIVASFVIVVAAIGWWALHPEDALAPSSSDVTVSEEDARWAPWPDGAPPNSVDVAPATTEPTVPSRDPLVRQRERLRSTAAQLRTRRDQAVAARAPERTVQMLEGHLARVERRLAALRVPSDLPG